MIFGFSQRDGKGIVESERTFTKRGLIQGINSSIVNIQETNEK